jgi:hypothetical protein
LANLSPDIAEAMRKIFEELTEDAKVSFGRLFHRLNNRYPNEEEWQRAFASGGQYVRDEFGAAASALAVPRFM